MADTQMTTRGQGAIYRSLVISIFADSRVLLLGILATVCGMALSGIVSQRVEFWYLAALTMAVGLLRYALGLAFERAMRLRRIEAEECVWWERWFTIGAVSYTLLLGLWCFFGAIISDQFVQIVSTAITFANIVGICGRSYPLRRLINLQLIAVSVPMLTGLIVEGGHYLWASFLLVPFLWGLTGIADWQRQTLLGNILQRRKAETLAGQMNATLDNVPLGICMFDPDGQLEIVNRHIQHILAQEWRSIRNKTLASMVSLMERQYGLETAHADTLRGWGAAENPKPLQMRFELDQPSGRRILEFFGIMMPNGGRVCTTRDVSEEVRANSQIEYMLRYDRLTGLMNRAHLTALVDAQLQQRDADGQVAVVMFSLQRFKQVNEVYGHQFGDRLLIACAKWLTETADDATACARFSGDGFGIVLSGKDCRDRGEHLADRLCEGMAQPFTIDGRVMRLSCNAGLAVSDGDTVTAADLFKQADQALLASRDESGNRWRVFNTQMDEEVQRRQRMEDDLGKAIERDELHAVYQPLVDVMEHRVEVCEALMRWEHATLGPIRPDIFIKLAEETGQIAELGAWMLKRACRDCASWPSDTRVAVNLSALHFRHADIVSHVRAALAESGLDASRLELEITESAMLDSLEETTTRLREFKRMGVSVSLDDFGTGYSSLSYMSSLPIDKLKIDRSFVLALENGQRSLTLLQAIAGMGRLLGLKVVIEGVETKAQLDTLLRHTTVNEIQGFLFCKPLPSSEVVPLLDADSAPGRNMLLPLSQILHRAA